MFPLPPNRPWMVCARPSALEPGTSQGPTHLGAPVGRTCAGSDGKGQRAGQGGSSGQVRPARFKSLIPARALTLHNRSTGSNPRAVGARPPGGTCPSSSPAHLAPAPARVPVPLKHAAHDAALSGTKKHQACMRGRRAAGKTADPAGSTRSRPSSRAPTLHPIPPSPAPHPPAACSMR